MSILENSNLETDEPTENFDICAICQENILSNVNSTRTECNHCFHSNCYVNYVRHSHRNDNCPVCRQRTTIPHPSQMITHRPMRTITELMRTGEMFEASSYRKIVIDKYVDYSIVFYGAMRGEFILFMGAVDPEFDKLRNEMSLFYKNMNHVDTYVKHHFGRIEELKGI